MRRKIAAANWKMHGTVASARALARAFAHADAAQVPRLVFPPSVQIASLAAEFAPLGLAFGGQDLSAHAEGAYTGEVSAAMLRDVGATHVLVGHSERRQLHGESDALVAAKFERAVAAGLIPLLCLGETSAERERDQTSQVLQRQLGTVLERVGIEAFAQAIIAYEPIWAIGTGITASSAEADACHRAIRAQIATHDAKIAGLIPIIYGGSVKPGNALELFTQPDVDGGLVGGASLIAADFLLIIDAARKAGAAETN